MIGFAFRRILGALPTLLLLATLVFFLLRLAPGGPFDGERAFPPDVMANIEARYGLDQPLLAQYWSWLTDLLRGDLRESFQYIGRPVTEIISEALPVSIGLGLWALVFAVVIGAPLGALAAWKRNSWIDHTAMFLAIAGVSLPSFLEATVLILIFSFWLGWFPPALWEGPSFMVLPVIALGLRPLAVFARLTRAAMVETLSQDFIRTAYSKGLPERRVIFKHALKNSLIPLVTTLGPISAQILTGSFVIEVIFQVPGIGKHFVQAMINRDYPLIMGLTLMFGMFLILANLVVDLLYGWIDPRIRIAGDRK
jgi:oligopeptide transport system permease protein